MSKLFHILSQITITDELCVKQLILTSLDCIFFCDDFSLFLEAFPFGVWSSVTISSFFFRELFTVFVFVLLLLVLAFDSFDRLGVLAGNL